MTKSKLEIFIDGSEVIIKKGTQKIAHNLVDLKETLNQTIDDRISQLNIELQKLQGTQLPPAQNTTKPVEEIKAEDVEKKPKKPVPSGFCQVCERILMSGTTTLCLSCKSSVHKEKCADEGICTDCLNQA